MTRSKWLLILALSAPTTIAHADALDGASLFPPTSGLRGGAEMETASFNVAGRRGSFASAVARIEYTPIERLNVRARVPIDTLSLDNEPQEQRSGLADTELRFRLQLLRGDPIRITGGWVFQLPTGSNRDGLGEGAVQVLPFVSGGYRIFESMIVYLTVSDSISFANPNLQRHPNYVDPGEDHELRVTEGLIYILTKDINASATLTETVILTAEDRGRALVTGSLQLGTQPDRKLRLVIAPQFPVAGEQRFSWKLNAAATYSF